MDHNVTQKSSLVNFFSFHVTELLLVLKYEAYGKCVWQVYSEWINYYSQRARGREECYRSHEKASACGHLTANLHLSWNAWEGALGQQNCPAPPAAPTL